MQSTNKHSHLKEKLISELKRFWLYTIVLTILFSSFNFYQRLLLNDFTNNTIPYGFSIIEALILAKIIIIGDAIHIGKRFSRFPLIVSVIHKSILFCLFVLLFTLFEHLFTGVVEGKKISTVYDNYINKKMNIAMARSLIMFYVFLLFFSVLDTSRALGQHELFDLFFKRRKM